MFVPSIYLSCSNYRYSSQISQWPVTLCLITDISDLSTEKEYSVSYTIKNYPYSSTTSNYGKSLEYIVNSTFINLVF